MMGRIVAGGGHGARPPRDPRATFCRRCGRTAEAEPPLGWYRLSVNVPPELDGKHVGYVWIGAFCSLHCLGRHLPAVAEQERLARQVYEPVPPVGP
jgi:hypothetical protein